MTAAAELGWADWTFDPTVVLGILALAGAYVVARHRGVLRRDDDLSAWSIVSRVRSALFVLGLATLYVALQSPLDRGGDRYLLSLHMTQHILLMMVAPPLLLLGICGAKLALSDTVIARVLPLGRSLTRVWPATVVFNAVLLIWHVPVLYDATLGSEPLHIVEHLLFIGAATLFWWPVVDPLRLPDSLHVGPLRKIAVLAVAGVPPTLLGFILVMSRVPLYHLYAAAPRLWGIAATTDQEIAGVLMFGLGNLVYFAAVTVIFFRMFESPEQDEFAAAHQGGASAN